MNKDQLEHLGDALAKKAGITQVDIIGSQSIHAHCDTPSATVLRSIECDILVKTNREGGWLAGFIREHFGSGSAYEREKGVFAEAIPRHRAVPLALPSDWEGRTKPLNQEDEIPDKNAKMERTSRLPSTEETGKRLVAFDTVSVQESEAKKDKLWTISTN